MTEALKGEIKIDYESLCPYLHDNHPPRRVEEGFADTASFDMTINPATESKGIDICPSGGETVRATLVSDRYIAKKNLQFQVGCGGCIYQSAWSAKVTKPIPQ